MQNPDVTETFRVLVIQPVKKVTIESESKKVSAGSRLQLTAVCTPENASIKGVTWSSKQPNVATVDENGVVTGLKKGSVNITATAADGSRVVGSVTINVTQPVESVTFSKNEYQVIAGRTEQVRVTVLPATANDRSVTWTSSDESIATIRNGLISGKKAGSCTVYCTSNSNPEVSGSATVVISQLVTRVENMNSPGEMNLLVGETVQTRWNVLPDDATNKALTFRSQQPKQASVDANGLVTALKKGTATIVAAAADASKKQGTVKVTVIQPVTGVEIAQRLHYVQVGGTSYAKAQVLPKDANNQRISGWYSDNEYIVSVRSNGTNTGALYGVNPGYATVTATTEDGGFVATTSVRVGYFNESVEIEDLDVNANNEIKITLRNVTQDITFSRIRFRVECYDLEGNALVCNTDGTSTSFEGEYTYQLAPYERTAPSAFRFQNMAIDQPLGSVVLTIQGWTDESGNRWNLTQPLTQRWDRYDIYQGEGVG